MTPVVEMTRRTILAAGAASTSLAIARAQSMMLPPTRRLAFSVWRNGHQIGRHALAFSGDDRDFVVNIDAAMAVAIGSIPVFKYRLQAAERWSGGQFAQLQSHTLVNGKPEQTFAVRGTGGVLVRTGSGSRTLPEDAMPLTHWNPHALTGPLFNPETGALMHVRVSQQPGRYTLTGDANITAMYDAQGVWTALRAKATDGSTIDYRRAG